MRCESPHALRSPAHIVSILRGLVHGPSHAVASGRTIVINRPHSVVITRLDTIWSFLTRCCGCCKRSCSGAFARCYEWLNFPVRPFTRRRDRAVTHGFVISRFPLLHTAFVTRCCMTRCVRMPALTRFCASYRVSLPPPLFALFVPFPLARQFQEFVLAALRVCRKADGRSDWSYFYQARRLLSRQLKGALTNSKPSSVSSRVRVGRFPALWC